MGFEGIDYNFVVKVLCKQLSDRCVGDSYAIRLISNFKRANTEVLIQYRLHAFFFPLGINNNFKCF